MTALAEVTQLKAGKKRFRQKEQKSII